MFEFFLVLLLPFLILDLFILFLKYIDICDTRYWVDYYFNNVHYFNRFNSLKSVLLYISKNCVGRNCFGLSVYDSFKHKYIIDEDGRFL